jgi:hypothetical protein
MITQKIKEYLAKDAGAVLRQNKQGAARAFMTSEN